MGRHADALTAARANIEAWSREIDGAGLDAIVINTSGCGTVVKDYGFMFRNDPLRVDAARIAALTLDISEFLTRIDYAPTAAATRPDRRLPFRLQPAARPKNHRRAEGNLLRRAGFTDKMEPAEPHICCGSAGTYNMLAKPDIAARLRTRKLAHLACHQADPDRRRQHGLRHTTVRRRHPGGAHGRAARLDGRRIRPRRHCHSVPLAMPARAAAAWRMRRWLFLLLITTPALARTACAGPGCPPSGKSAALDRLLDAPKAAPSARGGGRRSSSRSCSVCCRRDRRR